MITEQQKAEWLYRLSSLHVRKWPYPHAILNRTVPAALYRQMLDNIPPHEEFVPLNSTGRVGKGAYPQRFIYDQANAFWARVRDFLLTPEFGLALATPFGAASHLEQNRAWGMDTLFIEDLPGYRIGPHADARHKFISALFYLGTEKENDRWGTSIYLPKDHADVDPYSGRHYEFEQFQRVTTIPYLPNHGLMFLKNDRSWHGVEQIPAIEGERRIVLLADIKLRS